MPVMFNIEGKIGSELKKRMLGLEKQFRSEGFKGQLSYEVGEIEIIASF
ncbi:MULTISPECIES: hypothetical protein [Bacillaceae]|nr:hypothetical protein [Rossellomorea sp. YZS02]MBW3112796.1 hypothetical protein [Bacillus sp. MCCB 382]MDX8342775.1 hypothetical protein [Rossellomorea sp. YZS02]